MRSAIGIDFGTTNTVAALAHEGALVTAEITALLGGRPSRGMVERQRRM
jgi:molecular chaperone DnaK (HSP70)